jgi:FkbM family methyltransferase
MVGLIELERKNRTVLDLAASSEGGMTISQLHSQPPYYGFVEGVVFEDLRFVMGLMGSDDGVAMRWLWNHAYESMSLAMWSMMAREADVVFDIGAHTGVYSLAARIANTNSTVISFEPYSLNFTRLMVNLQANGLNLENIFNVAVSDEEGALPFTIQTSQNYHSTGGKIVACSDNATIDVQAIALDTMYRQYQIPINLIKIDVEGHEPNILRSMTNVLNDCAPDIFIEAIDIAAANECTAILKRHGYRFFCIDDAAMSIDPVDAIVPIFDNGAPNMSSLNRLATKKSTEEIFSLSEKTCLAWKAVKRLRA